MRQEYAMLGWGALLVVGIIAYLFYSSAFAEAGSVFELSQINSLYFFTIVIVATLFSIGRSISSVLERQVSIQEVRKEEIGAQGSYVLEERIGELEDAIRAGDPELAKELYFEAMRLYEVVASNDVAGVYSSQTYARLQRLYGEITGLGIGVEA